MSSQKYTAVFMGANSSRQITGNSIHGFLCKTGGTLTLTNLAGTNVIDAHPVTAGVWYDLPFLINNPAGGNGGTLTLAGGASGTLAA